MKKVVRLTESDLIRIVKRVINENRHDEKDIFISKGFKGVRMEFGGETASPSDIIELYNAYVEEGVPLVKYLGSDIFMNENDEEVDKYTVLDELDYAILGDEEINYGDEEEEQDDMPSYKTKWEMPSDDDFVNERLNNIVNRVINEQGKPGSSFIKDLNSSDKIVQKNKELVKPESKIQKVATGSNNLQWKNLVSELKKLTYKPYIISFTYNNIPSESLNWGRASKLSGGKGNYGLVISSTDSKSPKEQIQLFDTENKGNQMGMHRWWQSKGYETNGREIKIKFSEANKLKQDIELFFTKYPPVRVK